jgi:hypothetical protein
MKFYNKVQERILELKGKVIQYIPNQSYPVRQNKISTLKSTRIKRFITREF